MEGKENDQACRESLLPGDKISVHQAVVENAGGHWLWGITGPCDGCSSLASWLDLEPPRRHTSRCVYEGIPERLKLRREDGLQHGTRRKPAEYQHSLLFTSWPAQIEQAALCSCGHVAPNMMGCTLKLWAKINASPIKLLPARYLGIWSQRKVTLVTFGNIAVD